MTPPDSPSKFRLLLPAPLLLLLAALPPLPASAQTRNAPPPPPPAGAVRVVSWNTGAVFTVDEVRRRNSDFEGLARELQPDVLVLLEVTSKSVVDSIRDRMKMKKPDGSTAESVISDFNPDDSAEYAALEVGVVSRYPITETIEFDTRPNNPRRPARYREVRLVPPAILNPPRNFNFRGFLSVRVDDLKLVVVGTHLKSSRGQYGRQDYENAKQREYVAGAIAAHVAQLRRDFPEHTVLVVGDFNVGINDETKNGVDLAVDTFEGPGDRYDETHALLAAGLVDGLRMRPLTANIGQTFVGPGSERFRPAGAIDNIYVDGPKASAFPEARKSELRFGSDHLPVYVDAPLLAP